MWVRTIWELLRYEVVFATRGFPAIRRGMRELPTSRRARRVEPQSVCRAVDVASSFYWKPIRCLQRSVVTARMMRKSGIAAEVVIGVRTKPMMSHAWVEVDGRVVSDE